MNKTYYVCKYTPVELLESLGGECANFNHMPDGFDLAALEDVLHGRTPPPLSREAYNSRLANAV